jgi:hypothetical protein
MRLKVKLEVTPEFSLVLREYVQQTAQRETAIALMRCPVCGDGGSALSPTPSEHQSGINAWLLEIAREIDSTSKLHRRERH